MPIAIVGAGIAGLSAARRLKHLGHSPVVLDKSRGLGGRMATRRVEHLQFDHGAQFFTARGAAFGALVTEWMAAGVVAEWSDGIFVGTPAMTTPASALADGIDVMPAVEVAALERDNRLWTLSANSGPINSPLNGRFSAVILAVPAPQAVSLALSAGVSADGWNVARMAPCWALLLSVAQPLRIDGSYLRPQQSGVAWITRDSSKPGRNAAAHAYVLHATPDWSRANLEFAPADVVPLLLTSMRQVLGQDIHPTFAVAHRWRYALVEQPVGRDFGWDKTARIGACGDWFIGARIEDAFTSGLRLAEAIHADLGT